MKGKKPSLIEKEKELRQLYKKWPEFKKYLKMLGCSAQTAEDIFQESLLIYIRKKETPEFVLTVDPFYYVRNTGKLLWYNQARKEQKQATFSLESDVEELNDDWFQKEMLLKHMESAIESLGKKCQEILQLFYGLGWNMVEVAQKVGLRNDKVAKAQKYRCLSKAKEWVMANETTNSADFDYAQSADADAKASDT